MPADRRIRILIVDDSVVMRSLLRNVVGADSGIEVVASAADGESALRIVETARPDLILLDVEMPVMDGLATLRELRTRGHKMPVIMCSSLTQRGAAVTIEALAGGASDYVAKPSGQTGREGAMLALSQDLIPKIRALAAPSQVQPTHVFPGLASGIGSRHFPGSGGSASGSVDNPARLPSPFPMILPYRAQPASSIPVVLTIGVSTGGPAALDRILPELPAGFPLPVLVVQHMPESFTRIFAERLDGRCNLRVREAVEGESVHAGVIYVARGNWHMEVLAASRVGAPPTLHLNQGPPENHCRPAVDVLFRSASQVYSSGVLAVVLTGMGSDGLIGCRLIRERGGSVLAQDQATSTVWGMPGAVVHAGLAHRILPLEAIVPEILRMASRANTEARRLLRSAV